MHPLVTNDRISSDVDRHDRTAADSAKQSSWIRAVLGAGKQAWVMLLLSFLVVPTAAVTHGGEGEPLGGPPIRLQNAILKTVLTVTVAAEAKGVLAEVPVDIGTTIQPGDCIAKIRDDDVRVQLAHAQLELTLARQKSQSDIDVLVTTKSAAVAENEYRRAIEANRSVPNTYPPNEIDRLELLYDRTQLEVRRAEEERSQLAVQTQLAENRVLEIETSLRKHTITAPTEGVLVSVEHHAGEWVEPGAPIATIVNVNQLRIEGFAEAADAARISIGDPAEVEIQDQDNTKRFQGRVLFVSPDVNSVSGLVRVFVDVDNVDGELRPGVRTTVKILGKGS